VFFLLKKTTEDINATTKNKTYAFWLINIAESKINKTIPAMLIKI
jgi:hypothetical protein